MFVQKIMKVDIAEGEILEAQTSCPSIRLSVIDVDNPRNKIPVYVNLDTLSVHFVGQIEFVTPTAKIRLEDTVRKWVKELGQRLRLHQAVEPKIPTVDTCSHCGHSLQKPKKVKCIPPAANGPATAEPLPY